MHALQNSFSSSLDYPDSNRIKQNQNLLCYHYTIVHCIFPRAKLRQRILIAKEIGVYFAVSASF